MPKPDKKGLTVLTFDNFQSIKKKFKMDRMQKEEDRRKMPQLHLDYELRKMIFNKKECNLKPSIELIKTDIQYFIEYMEGFNIFSGDINQNKKNYFLFANWFLASPFMPYLRDVAFRQNHDIKQFPVYAILYGESNGGKTEFVKMLTKMICGRKLPVNKSADFVFTTIDALKQSCEGVPIVIDDLDKQQYQNHASKVMKYDEWGIKEHLINFPSIAITTNEIPAIKPEISKRAYICHIDACLDKDKSRLNYRKINECMEKMTNSFYCEYSRRMFESVNEICEKMKEENDEYLPDIFETSSQVIYSIFSEALGDKLPFYIRICNYSDYFGNKAVGKNAIQKIQNAWAYEPEAFTILKKKGLLEYKIPESLNVYELKYIKQELPPSLNAVLVNRTLKMDLTAAKEYFEIDFKKKVGFLKWKI